MLDATVRSALTAAVGEDNVISDPVALRSYE